MILLVFFFHFNNKNFLYFLVSIVEKIKPALEKVKQKYPSVNDNAKLIEYTVEENVLLQTDGMLKNSKVISKSVEEGKLKVVNGVYNLDSGKVTFL